MKYFTARACALLAVAVTAFLPNDSSGETLIQYFNTDWNEIATKMPELAEAGYDAIWLRRQPREVAGFPSATISGTGLILGAKISAARSGPVTARKRNCCA